MRMNPHSHTEQLPLWQGCRNLESWRSDEQAYTCANPWNTTPRIAACAPTPTQTEVCKHLVSNSALAEGTAAIPARARGAWAVTMAAFDVRAASGVSRLWPAGRQRSSTATCPATGCSRVMPDQCCLGYCFVRGQADADLPAQLHCYQLAWTRTHWGGSWWVDMLAANLGYDKAAPKFARPPE